LIVDLVLNAAGVAGDVIRKGPYNRADLASGLSRGDFDAVFARNMYPAAFVQTAIHQGARLISIDGPRIDGLPSDYPFLQRVSIPPGVYVGQTERVRTIAVDVILVCRADLDEELAHELTEYLFRAVSRVPAYHDALQFIEIHEASATPIPLHDGAARYYRELELFR
jgi:TRAP transporter TAXI family solute receptor